MPLILILDDHATNRSIYGRLAALIADDVSVESFSDPLDALEWLAVNPVDLVITDYKMPGMNGAEFTRRLRAEAVERDVPVVVVTAHDDRSFRQHAMEAGATDFLRSPVDHFEFVARARNLLALPRRAAAAGPGRSAPPSDPPTRLVVENLPGLVSATDRIGRCLFVNARQARRAGATPEELIGQDIARVLGAERAARSRAKDLEVLQTGRQLPSYWEEAPDPGGGRVLLTAKAPLRGADGSVIGVLSTSLEVEAAVPPRASSCQERRV
jgi:PAS domain S-box-containing protein